MSEGPAGCVGKVVQQWPSWVQLQQQQQQQQWAGLHGMGRKVSMNGCSHEGERVLRRACTRAMGMLLQRLR